MSLTLESAFSYISSLKLTPISLDVNHENTDHIKPYAKQWAKKGKEYRKSFAEDDLIKSRVRGSLRDPKYDHIANTQEMCLKGAANLDPLKDIIIVCGAQYFNGKCIEPLPELLHKCRKMVLLDIDACSLKGLEGILKSPKVVTKTMDLSFMYKHLKGFEDAIDPKWTPKQFLAEVVVFLEKMNKANLDRRPGFPGVLQTGEKAAFIISSLVASQPAIIIGQYLNSLFRKFYPKEPFSDIGDETGDKGQHFTKFTLDFTPFKHAQDVCQMAKKVYIADTVELNGKPYCSFDFNRIKSELERPGVKVELKEWFWLPFKVHALLVL